MRRRPVIAVAALAAVLAAGPAAAAEPPAPVPLDRAAWRYAPDARDRGARQHWERGRGRPAWRNVRIPHVFDAKPDPATFRGGVGWYRLRLREPAGTPRGFTWAIRFEQIRRVAHVWLDGRRVAVHRDPYAPFTVALPALRDGRRHTLVVRVDNRKGDEIREGWWNWGGITRPATLVPQGAVTTEQPGFLPQRTCDAVGACRWSVLVDAIVVNRGRREVRPALVARLTGPDGGAPHAGGAAAGTAGAGAAASGAGSGDPGAGAPEAGAAEAPVRSLAPGERARVRFSVPVTGPVELWQPGHPALYGITLETRAGDAVQQLDRARIGLRTVGVRNGLLELNGRTVQLRGASIQEDVKGHGPALTDDDVDAIVAKLQALGATVTRAHYALDERLARRLDEAGILVWAQAPIYHHDRLLETPRQRRGAIATVRAAVLATRNHPSTLTHSVANELSTVPDQVPGTAAFLRAARAATLDLDPTLPTAVDTLSYPGYDAQRAYGAFALLGINSYFGWYPGKAGHSTANLADLAPYLQHMRAMYPQAGLVVTEFGAESTFDGPANVKETYAFQAGYARDVLRTIAADPQISGAIYWTLQEFAVKPHWDGGAKRTGVKRDSIHNKGLITYSGRRKPAFDVVRDDAARTPLFRPQVAVAHALGTSTRAPQRAAAAPGATAGWIAILVAVAAILAVDAWALLGWRAATAAAVRDAREDALRDAAADADRRRHLRLIA